MKFHNLTTLDNNNESEYSLVSFHRSVICTDPDISSVPAGFPVDTSKLRIEKTSIQQIQSGAFNYLFSLEFLWMSFNTLSTLNLDSFRGLFNLEELRLDGNALTSFPWESIMDMPSLRLLDLHNNRLTSLPAEATAYTKNLTYLDLSSNNMVTLPSEVLASWLTVKPAQGPESSKIILGKCHPYTSRYMCEVNGQIKVLLDLKKKKKPHRSGNDYKYLYHRPINRFTLK